VAREIAFVETNSAGTGVLAMRCAKRLGFRTHFLTRDPERYRTAMLNPIDEADDVTTVDTMDFVSLVRCLVDRDVAGVIACDDFRLLPAAGTALALGIGSVDRVRGLANARFKDRCRALVNPVSHPVRFASVHVSTTAGSPIGYPCVVKPVDESGSFAVVLCRDDADYAAAVARIRAHRTHGTGYALSEHVLVEEFIAGPEYSAELVWLTATASWQLIGFTKKIVTEPPNHVEIGHVFPHVFGSGIDARIGNRIVDCVRSIGLVETAAHVEFKLVGGEPAIIEINPRLGGDQIVDLVQLATGVDLVEHFVAAHTGVELPSPGADDPARYAAIAFLTTPAEGTVEAVRDPADGVAERLYVKPLPMTVRGLRSSDDRLGFAIATAASPVAALANAQARVDAVEIRLAPAGVS